MKLCTLCSHYTLTFQLEGGEGKPSPNIEMGCKLGHWWLMNSDVGTGKFVKHNVDTARECNDYEERE